MKWEIITYPAIKIAGARQSVSNKQEVRATVDLRAKFAPYKNALKDRVNGNFLFIRKFGENYSFEDENAVYEKWAAAEVSGFDNLPENLEGLSLAGGKYILFYHIGPAVTFPHTITMFFKECLPQSGMKTDFSREMIEEFAYNYRSEYIFAQEKIYMPVK
jgi:AraC family transcriptional regulator